MAIIVLDPGHGGWQDLGGSSADRLCGPAGMAERVLTLDIAQRAERMLCAGGHRVQVTRQHDDNVSLGSRIRAARDQRADVFVSIHFNEDADPSLQGCETWVHQHASGGSLRLADAVQRRLSASTGHPAPGVQRQTLGVLDPSWHAPSTACCLTEVSYLTDPAEERRLGDPSYRSRIAEGIAAAVGDFLREQGPSPGRPRYGHPHSATDLSPGYAPAPVIEHTKIAVVAPAATFSAGSVRTVRSHVQGAFTNVDLVFYDPSSPDGTTSYPPFGQDRVIDGVGYQLAGTDADRIEALWWALTAPGITGVICVRGGYGSMRIMDELADRIRGADDFTPRRLVGYSDITAVHHTLFAIGNTASLHGPTFKDFKDINSESQKTNALTQLVAALTSDQGALFGADPVATLSSPGAPASTTLAGPLLGGNLSVFTHFYRSDYLPHLQGAILFVEDVNESPRTIDRMLEGLYMRGAHTEVRAVVVGQLTRCGLAERKLAEHIHDRWGVPTFHGLDVGHGLDTDVVRELDRTITVWHGAQHELVVDAAGTSAELRLDAAASPHHTPRMPSDPTQPLP